MVPSTGRLYVAAADGSNARALGTRALTDVSADQYRFSWMPDGSRIVYGELNEILSVDAATGQSVVMTRVPAGRRVAEVSVRPDASRLAYRVTSADGLVTDVVEFDLRANLIDTIIADTTGLITGPVYSPSGNEVLVTIDVSGQENPRRRQLDARVFEFDLVRDTRRLISADKPAGGHPGFRDG